MTEDLGNILEKFTDEKFKGKKPEWRDAKWGDVEVLCTQDKENWYYRHVNSIYVQAKEGDKTPHCYECESKINFKRKAISVWAKEFSGTVGGGDVKIKHIPYCPNCEDEPNESGIIME